MTLIQVDQKHKSHTIAQLFLVFYQIKAELPAGRGGHDEVSKVYFAKINGANSITPKKNRMKAESAENKDIK